MLLETRCPRPAHIPTFPYLRTSSARIKEVRGNRQTEGLCGLFRSRTNSNCVGCSTRRSAGWGAFQDAIHVVGRTPKQVRHSRPIGHQASRLHERSPAAHRGQPVLAACTSAMALRCRSSRRGSCGGRAARRLPPCAWPAKALSNASGLRTSRGYSWSPKDCAALSNPCRSILLPGCAGFQRTATRETPGQMSRSKS